MSEGTTKLIAEKEKKLLERVYELIPECKSPEQVTYTIQSEIDFHKSSTEVRCGNESISLPDNIFSEVFVEMVRDLWEEYWKGHS